MSTGKQKLETEAEINTDIETDSSTETDIETDLETPTEVLKEKDQVIAALNQTVADMKTQMQAMMSQFSAAMHVKNQEIIETKVDLGVDLQDDRNELIEIAINMPNTGFMFKTVSKRDGFKELVEWFRNKRSKVPDHGDIYDKNTNEIRVVNSETVYIRMRKRDISSGKYKTVIHQVPLWIAVDRTLQGHDVELIAKGEYDKHMSEKLELERKFNEDYYAKKKLRAMEAIAKLPQ